MSSRSSSHNRRRRGAKQTLLLTTVHYSDIFDIPSCTLTTTISIDFNGAKYEQMIIIKRTITRHTSMWIITCYVCALDTSGLNGHWLEEKYNWQKLAGVKQRCNKKNTTTLVYNMKDMRHSTNP